MKYPIKPRLYDTLPIGHPKRDQWDKDFEIYKKYITSLDMLKNNNIPQYTGNVGFISIKSLYNLFLLEYKIQNKKDFNINYNDGEGYMYVYTLMYFLYGDVKFYGSPLIQNKITINEIERALYTNTDKGLSVSGGTGCGKSTITKALLSVISKARYNETKVHNTMGELVPLHCFNVAYRYITAKDLVTEYEGTKQEEIAIFWQKYKNCNLIIDDILSEPTSMRYTKLEVLQVLLEIRSDDNIYKTSVISNYVNSDMKVEDIYMAILSRYGHRVFSRLFSLFNIISLKGNDLRILM